ncbi:hypothetical protein M1V18_004392 [Salmonella enterica]|nr:hypothetical protein [Salmonella enterica]
MFLEVLNFVLPLVILFVFGIGLWALGQWLRRKGHGERLDKIDARMNKAQRATARMFGPLSGALIGVGRTLSRIPLLGSKNSRAMWDDLEKHTPRPDRSKNKQQE